MDLVVESVAEQSVVELVVVSVADSVVKAVSGVV